MLEQRLSESTGENRIGWGEVYEKVKNNEFDENQGLMQIVELAQIKSNLVND